MQGVSASRVAHLRPSFGRSPGASPSPRQHLLLLGFQQRCRFFKCGGEAFAPATRRLKTSPQDEPFTEDALPLLVEAEVSTKLAEVATNDAALKEGPKVSVKFILEKNCQFGQRFNVVGNHPLLGNWEVEAALPMEWSEGDIWIAESDVPAEMEVEFKFVLTGEKGEFEWQPGPNRVFSTVEGVSPLVVSEAWESVDEVATEAAVGETSDLVESTTSSDVNGILVPANITEEAPVNEVVKALESKDGGDAAKPEPETAPEIPLAELDVAVTAVKTALGVNDAA